MNASLNHPMSLQNKKIVITGGTGILGQKFCHALAAQGAQVCLGDLDGEQCQQLAAELTETYSQMCFGFALDLSNKASVGAFAKNAQQALGDVDVLINNAAAKPKGFFASTEDYDLETWNQTLAVNITGMFLTVQAFAPQMLARKQGNIVNISSIYGVVGPDQSIYEGSWYEALGGAINTPLVYSTTKAAVIGLTKHLATTWGKEGIRVNAISPGGVTSGQNSEFNQRYSARVPMNRMANAEEIVGAMLYLVSDASSYVNGHNLIVDGGLTAW